MISPVLVSRRALPYLLATFLLGALAAVLILGPMDLMRDAMVGEGGVTEPTVSLLLLVPVGVTVVVLLRTMVGLDTFGIFAPMILALTFLTVGIVVGLAVLGALILVGTVGRLLLDRYPSLAIARAGIIVSLAALVLFSVTFIGSAGGDRGLLQAGAFPLVITAGIIERFASAQMDDDPKEAARLLLFTVISSVVVWGIISAGPVQAVVRSRPDVILLCFPAQVLMGRYSGLRLIELFRFREVAGHARVKGMWGRYRSILGINRRNLEILDRQNPRGPVLLAGSKLRTKDLLAAQHVPVPQTHAVIRSRSDLNGFAWNVPDEFALKPSGGWRGEGIVVAVGRNGSGWRLADGSVITRQDLSHHIIDILDGVFSMAGGSDEAYFEQRLRSSSELAHFEARGLPDIRVIVYGARPILAMMRLPTRESRGKANLHQGAVGVGIDLEKGVTVHAVHAGRSCTRHPDSGRRLVGVAVPRWPEIMSLAVRAANVSGLGYAGVDIALDDTLGPVVLELNARPGLDIQIANMAGLRSRLNDGLTTPNTSPLGHNGPHPFRDLGGYTIREHHEPAEEEKCRTLAFNREAVDQIEEA